MEFITQHYYTLLIALPALFALLIGFVPAEEDKGIHKMATVFSVIVFLFSALSWTGLIEPVAISVPWIKALGAQYAMDADGLSLTLVFLTTLLLLLSVVASHSNITKRLRLYYSMVFLLITAILGVFLARDLFLFFLFWELELIPMYFLIAIWGGPNRKYASIKFVLYTLFGSVFLVAGVLAFYFHAKSQGIDSNSLLLFSTAESIAGSIATGSQILIFIAMFTTFAVKLPMVPFHTWLPDAHVEAPTPISMLLAGILLKMGSYGMLKICYGFLPQAAIELAPYIGLLALINIVYTAGVALVQKDMKKLIAYSSVSHMGFVLLGLASMNAIGFNGAVFVMFSHGLVSAALFMCVGTLYIRTHSRQISDYGGFGEQVPAIFYFFLFFAMASLGLPLLVSFASETLVFYGAYVSQAFDQINFFGVNYDWSIQTITIFSAIGVILGAAYLLWLLKRVFYGEFNTKWSSLTDATPSEVFVLGTLAVLTLAYGFFPQLITSSFESDVTRIAHQQYPDYIVKQEETLSPVTANKSAHNPLLSASTTGVTH